MNESIQKRGMAGTQWHVPLGVITLALLLTPIISQAEYVTLWANADAGGAGGGITMMSDSAGGGGGESGGGGSGAALSDDPCADDPCKEWDPYLQDCVPCCEGDIVNPCISREEEQIGGGWCRTDWDVGDWEEKELGPGPICPYYTYTWVEMRRLITFNHHVYVNHFCVTTYTVCRDGNEEQESDWPGDLVRREIKSTMPRTLEQKVELLKKCPPGWTKPPTCSYPELPPDPPNEGQCPEFEEGDCPPCEE